MSSADTATESLAPPSTVNTTSSNLQMPAISSSLASPSTTFNSTRVGGPSFGSYATAAGNRTFDAAGRLTSITDANFAVTNFGYDAAGNLASLSDPVQNTTRWAHDGQNRLTQETNELGDSRNYVYDAAGDLTRYIDAGGAVREYVYDAEHRAIGETWYACPADADAGQNAQNVIEYAYDAAGRLISESDNYSSVVYAYNDAGQITSTTTSSDSTPTVTLDYQYDSDGQRTQMAAMIDGVSDFVDDYAYDASGRVVSVIQHGADGGNTVAEKEITLDYNDNGQLQSIQRRLDGQLTVQADYAYDDSDRLVGLIYHQGGATLASYTWSYSDSGATLLTDNYTNADWLPNGGLPAEFVDQGMLPVHDTRGVVDAIDAGGYAELSRLLSCTSSADGTATYSYDAIGQLIAATYTGGVLPDESYTYDANGNRTGTGYIIGLDNRLLCDGTFWYIHDPEGNRIARFIDVNANAIMDSGDTDITEYQWDARNRLVEVTDRSTYGGDPTQVVDYLYDLENRWIGKRIDQDGDGVFDYQEGYVYDGNQVVLQFEGDGDLSHRYLWQPDAVDQLMADEQITQGLSKLSDLELPQITPQVYGPLPMPETASVFEPVSLLEPFPFSKPKTSEVIWSLTDHLGTVRDLATYDSETGETSIANHLTYDSYGQKQSETNAAVDSLFAFTGRPLDESTALQNNLNRWYDASVGRWVSEDPIGFEGRDVNPYRYVGNSATDAIDPIGLYESRTRRAGKMLRYDWAGRQLLSWWLSGDCNPNSRMTTKVIIDDEEWSDYMKAAPRLAGKVSLELTRLAVNYAKEHGSGTFAINKKISPLVLEEGEGVIGYQYLGGVNPYFEMYGSITVTHPDNQPGRENATVTFTDMKFRWFDTIDPNPKYSTDTMKAIIGKTVTLGKAKDYKIVITWSADSITFSFDEDGKLDTENYTVWPFRCTKRPPVTDIPTEVVKKGILITGPPYFGFGLF